MIVVSSDLSHFHDDETARRRDAATADMIEHGAWARLAAGDACGYLAIAGLLIETTRRGLKATRLILMQLGRHRGIARPRGGLRSLDVRRERRHSPSAALRRLAVSATPSSVAAIDLERGFEVVRSKAAGPAEGVFGPGSTIWQVDREALVFLGAGRALLLQLAHPWVSTAIAEHSTALSDPIGRFHRTFEIIFTLVFGSLEQALATSRRLHRRHAAISGHLPETLGPYAKGSPYLANEVSALMWVHATLVETALAVHDLVLGAARDRAAGALLRGLPVAWSSVRYSARRTAAGLAGFRPVLRSYGDVRGAGRGSGSTGHRYAHACRCRAHPNTTMVPEPYCPPHAGAPPCVLWVAVRGRGAAERPTCPAPHPAHLPRSANSPSLRRALPRGTGAALRPEPA